MSDRTTRFVAGGLVAVGGLMVLLCGSCTLIFGGGGLIGLLRGEDAGLSGFILGTALIVGGLPTGAGLLLLVNGLRSWKANRPPSP
ncbi:MAG: hypothetical protein EPO51_00645 [Phenylobacterium sp.]|uniref:hypothetical protein n=1 Tax=Phenylobacterium sp. TaxID=1871053 RepID=UPI001220C3A9|nr:hypothetical protein [Phenylobacterium sp.]TAJ74598.1 MAG: hypothetical protein EPO51_00645 [Phenylobacterium sp.]